MEEILGALPGAFKLAEAEGVAIMAAEGEEEVMTPPTTADGAVVAPMQPVVLAAGLVLAAAGRALPAIAD